jgi:prophage regulatory protein
METATTTAPRERLLRLPEVLDRVGMRTTAWYEGMKKGVHPKPVKRGRSSLWPESEINAYVQRVISESR